MKYIFSNIQFRDDKQGFSLLEILIVMAVISLSIIALSNQIDVRSKKITPINYARNLQDIMIRERLEAISTGNEQKLIFDFTGQTKTIWGKTGGGNIPKNISIRLLTGRELLNESNHTASVIFFPDGSSTGAEVFIRSKGFDNAKVKINWLTGGITIETDG